MTIRTVVTGAPVSLYTSELAFVAAQQSQAGSLAAVALHDLALLLLLPLVRRLRIGGSQITEEAARSRACPGRT